MTLLGITLLLVGTILVIAEAHVPGGILGLMGGAALMTGGVIAIVALGGGATLAVPVGFGLGAAVAGWALVVVRTSADARRGRVRAGAEALCGRLGVVRVWNEPAGQVFVDGALWRARQEWPESGEAELREGDPVVVERVSGLTLSVRRADEWELIG